MFISLQDPFLVSDIFKRCSVLRDGMSNAGNRYRPLMGWFVECQYRNLIDDVSWYTLGDIRWAKKMAGIVCKVARLLFPGHVASCCAL